LRCSCRRSRTLARRAPACRDEHGRPDGAERGTLTRIVLASSNEGKLRELQALLDPFGLTLTPQSALGIDAPPETGTTFLENALLKARHAAGLSGVPALADDSGIEVDALQGRPGVYSARYAGEGASDADNVEKMLQELLGVPPAKRTARYQGVIVLLADANDESPVIARGTWEGRIASAPRGAGGFGYDPIFVPCGFDRTAAELSATEKNAISHRGQALRSLVAKLEDAGRRIG
jgi:XTP/dITP diphosphohydrolase